jgi:hypothetical protein
MAGFLRQPTPEKTVSVRECAISRPLSLLGILRVLEVMRPSDDPKQTWIGCSSQVGVVHDQLHLAADALESRLYR